MEERIDPGLLSYIFNSTDNSVCITDKDGTLEYTNPAANELFGISSDSDRQKKIWDLIPIVKRNDDLIQLFIDGIQEKKTTHQALVEFVNIEKKVFRLWVNLTYVGGKEGKYVIVISDLTLLLKVNDAFERYTSPQIADYVLNDPRGQKQGGESREITVLMSDLRGFTAISAELEPAILLKSLNKYFEKMVAVIERFGGTVIEFLGDGIFVVFGAPKEDEKHAENAIICAIEMQNAMASVNEWNRNHGAPELEMGIGINSGPAIIGNIGSKQKMKYGVLGYTVNIAGRVEGFTVGRQIFITENTRKLVQSELLLSGERSFLPKGAAAELKLYEVYGVGDKHILDQASHQITWKWLNTVKKVKFQMVDGKAVEKTAHSGTVTAISDNGHYMILRTRLKLKVSDNIMIRSGLTMYAKVIGKEEQNFIIAFTLRPDGFSDWVKTLS